MPFHFAAFVAILLASPASIVAQPPAPDPKPTAEQLIAKLVETRKQLAELRKVEAATAAELLALLKDLTERLKELGIAPGPAPPAPPDPKPPPVDPLAKKLRDAFAADLGGRADARQLAALYHLAADLAVKKLPKSEQYEVPSSKELLRQVREASTKLIGDFALPSLRTVVAGELAAALGNPSDTAFTAEQRAAAAALFAKLAAILEGL